MLAFGLAAVRTLLVARLWKRQDRAQNGLLMVAVDAGPKRAGLHC